MKINTYFLNNLFLITICSILNACNLGNANNTSNNYQGSNLSSSYQTVNFANVAIELKNNNVTIPASEEIELPQSINLPNSGHTLFITTNQLNIPQGFTLTGGSNVVIYTNTVNSSANDSVQYVNIPNKNSSLTIEQYPTNYANAVKIISSKASEGKLVNILAIKTWKNFKNISQNMYGNYVIESDLNGNSEVIYPFNFNNIQKGIFCGSINGQNHSISNFILDGKNIGGLFIQVNAESNNPVVFESIVFSNIVLQNATSLLTTLTYVDTARFDSINNIIVNNLLVKSLSSSTNANINFGGLIATNMSANLNNIAIDLKYYALNNLNINDFGGMVGTNEITNVSNAYVRIAPANNGAPITVSHALGGMVGEADIPANFTNVGVTGTLDIGQNNYDIGGIAGINNSNFTNAYVDVTMYANLSESLALDAVSDGFGSVCAASFNNIYVLANPLPSNIVTHSYAKGILIGDLICSNFPQSEFVGDFISNTGNVSAVGGFTDGYFTGINKVSNLALQQQSTFTAWDFINTWTLANPGSGYPYPYFKFQQGIMLPRLPGN